MVTVPVTSPTGGPDEPQPMNTRQQKQTKSEDLGMGSKIIYGEEISTKADDG